MSRSSVHGTASELEGSSILSLVSCAVALYPATTTSQRIRFNITNRDTGNRIRNKVLDAETGDPD